MSTESNVYSQGGGGTHYEFEVQTAFFTSFILGCEIPGLPSSYITAFRQQAGSLGYATDDLLLQCSNPNGKHLALFQVKHNITISEKSELFKEVIEAAWKDFTNTLLFNQDSDRIYLVKSALTVTEKNHLKQLLNWAQLKSTCADFLNEVKRIKEKSNYYTLFKTLATQIDASVTDEQLFKFLKCFDVLEYDFGNESSVSRTNFLSLIQLAKASDEVSTINVWNAIFAVVSNSNSKGGYFTATSIPSELFNFFNKEHYSKTQKNLLALSKQNYEILEFIDDTIGGVNIERADIINESLEKFNENQILILSGDPGVGKSAVAKTFIFDLIKRNEGYILLFKADQLNSANLRDLFVPFNINLTIGEIFSHFPLYTNNIIYIDAVEKLLEGEGLAFKQLIKAVIGLPVKVVLTCRKANLNLIELKFFHQKKYSILNMPPLSDNELEYIAQQVPVLKSIINNKRLLSLIRIPKYLDYACKAISHSGDDYADINEVEFINRLWSIIVENKFNENHSGLPNRRSKLFIELAALRSKLMQPFIRSPLDDDVAIEKLEKDNVIVQSAHSGLYAPAHDVLEDWALIRYVNDRFSNIQDDKSFFVTLGTEPAMRRAYRLWVQSALKNHDESKINFFTRNLNNTDLDKFWKDESLIAVLNSDYCETFFTRNLSLLKENDWKLFFQMVHVMRTACRENYNEKKFFIPTGNGWTSAIKIIDENISEIPEQYYSLIKNTLDDWSNIIFAAPNLPEATRPAGKIIFYLLNNYFKKGDTYYYENSMVQSCIKLLFNFSGGLTKEIESFLKEAATGSVRDENTSIWIEVRYYEKIIELALSGLASTQLCKYLPDTIISLLKDKWYRKPKKPGKKGDHFLSYISEPSWYDVNYHFGLVKEHRLDYFPASAYQTPVLWLLRTHPFKTLDFVIELINYSTEKYIASDFAKDDNCIEVELTLDDGTKIKQHGNSVLWLMYRGTGKVTPYLLQSVLMALEYYLLEIGKWGDNFKEFFQTLLRYLYVKSMSVATTSVVASACMAFPVMAGKQILPLYTSKELLSLDVVRYTHDVTPFHLASTHPAFDEERIKSDKLPHRQYSPGLQGYIVHYCFNIGLYNQDLFSILDEHRKHANADDVFWLKKLDEMDVRTWRPTKEYTEDGKVGVLIEPTYNEGVKDKVEALNKERDKANTVAGYKLLLLKIQKKEQTIPIDKWREINSYYKSLESYDVMDHAPGTLAMIGIRDLWSVLTDEEKEWSILFILEIIQKSIDKQYRPYELSWDYSPYDIDSAMMVFTLITVLPEIQHERENFDKLFIKLLITHYQINDPDYKLFLQAVDTSLWEIAPDDALRFFKALIAFAKFTKENPFYIDHRYSEEQVKEYNEKYASFIKEAYENKFPNVIGDFNYTDYSKWVLHKALVIVPAVNPSPECLTFIKKLLDLWLQKEAAGTRSNRYDELDHHIKYALQEKLSSIIFWNADTIGGDLLEHVISIFYGKGVLGKAFDGNEIWSFFRSLIKNLILIADQNLPDNNPTRVSHTIKNFRKLWTDFDRILLKMPAPIFSDLLLLDIEWRESAMQWVPIDEMADFFEKAISKYGAKNISSVFNLLSHVGDKTLLPQGLKWLIIILKTDKESKPILSYKNSEQLMLRVYENHISELRVNKELLENYLWMLDEMISQGSSDAYWIREFLISFKYVKEN